MASNAILVNPRRKAAKRRRRRNPTAAPTANPSSNPRRRRRRRNPLVGTVEMRPVRVNARRRRRNPPLSFKGLGGVNIGTALKDAAIIGVGIYGSRYVARAVMGAKDTGAMGYGATALSALGIALGARMVGASKETAQKLAAAGAVSLVGRAVVDVAKKVGATGPLIAGLQDYQYGLSDYQYGLSGLGIPELDVDGEGLSGLGAAPLSRFFRDSYGAGRDGAGRGFYSGVQQRGDPMGCAGCRQCGYPGKPNCRECTNNGCGIN